MAKANKLIPVVDGTAGTPIELIDSRIDINNPTNEDLLMYNSFSGKFEANSIGAVVTEVALTGDYNDLTNKPTIPDSTSDLTNDSSFITVNDVPQEVFVCNYDVSNHTMDKTITDIYNAYTAGKIIVCKSGTAAYYLEICSDVSCRFHAVINTGELLSFKFIKYLNGTWSEGQDDWNSKQNKLIGTQTTGQNLKTVNGNSLLGSGDVTIGSGDVNVQSDWNQTDTTADDYIKNKPTIPAAQVNSDWNATSGVAQILNKPTLATVATSGSYNDLSNKPTIPTVPTHRTINHEQITDSSLGDANLHDGFYFPNAVQDYDGNWYGAVVIGDQVWLGENLRTTHLADGTVINDGSYSGTNLNYHDYSTHTLPVEKRGLLYSYPVANSASGTIMANWKTPTSSELSALNTYLTNQSRYSAVAKAMAATDGWASSETANAVGNNLSLNNSSGLTLYPSGGYSSNGESNTNNCILWATKSSNLKTCLYISQNSTEYGTTDYNYSSWMLAIRLLSVFNPIQFRDWYVKTYGTLQYKLDELPSISGNSGKVLAVNSGATGIEWVAQSGGGTTHKETHYASCSTATATSAKAVTLTGYEPQDGDLLAVKFTYDAGSLATLSINEISYGINVMGISDTECILAGDTVLFSLRPDSSPSQAVLLSIDRASLVASTLNPIHIYNGSTVPSSSLGNDGDIYIQTAS